MCFCVLLYFTACMLYYCNTVGWASWDWGLIWWLTILLQCFDTVGWVTWPVKISSPNDLYCVEWDVKPYSTQPFWNLEHKQDRQIRLNVLSQPHSWVESSVSWNHNKQCVTACVVAKHCIPRARRTRQVRPPIQFFVSAGKCTGENWRFSWAVLNCPSYRYHAASL